MKNDSNEREFDLGIILSVTTSRLFTDIENIYNVSEYLSGKNVNSHQIPDILGRAKPYILSLYPDLEGIGEDEVFSSKEDVDKFVNKQKEVFGETLPLKPMYKKADIVETVSHKTIK